MVSTENNFLNFKYTCAHFVAPWLLLFGAAAQHPLPLTPQPSQATPLGNKQTPDLRIHF